MHRDTVVEFLAKAIAKYRDDPDWTRNVAFARYLFEVISEEFFLVKKRK